MLSMIERWKSEVPCGTRATARRRESSVMPETDWPSIRIAPPWSSNWRSSSDTRVDLPAPLCPTSPTFSPPSIRRSKSPPNTGALR